MGREAGAGSTDVAVDGSGASAKGVDATTAKGGDAEAATHIESLARRVATLEFEARRWRRVAVLGAGLSVAWLTTGAGEPVSGATPLHTDVLEVERLVVRAADGTPALEVDAGSLRVTAVGADGGRATTRVTADGMTVERERDDEIEAILEVGVDEVDLVDYAREGRAVMTASTFRLQHGIVGVSEAPVRWVSLQRSGFVLEDAQRRPRGEFGWRSATTEDEVRLVVRDASGAEIRRTPR